MSFARAPGKAPEATGPELVERRGRPGPEVLALARTIGNRAATRLLARQVAPAQPQGFSAWVLRYRDADGNYTDDDGEIRWRRIRLDEPEFVEDYVDANIDHASVSVSIDSGSYALIEVSYRNGRQVTFRREQIPNPNKRVPRRHAATVTPFTEFEKHEDDGLIYPSFHGTVLFSEALTPNLVSLREQADEIAEQLAQLRELATIAAAFGKIMGQYSNALGALHGAGEETSASVRMGNRSNRRAAPPPSTVEEPSSRPVGPNGEEERVTPLALPETPSRTVRPPARTGRPPARRGEPEAPSEIPSKPARKRSARPFNHKDPESRELSGQREPESSSARTARLDRFRARMANFAQTVKPNEVKPAPPGPNGSRAGHAETEHGWTKQMQADLLNRPERVFSGINEKGRDVDIYFRGEDVVITEAGKKTSVITAYGRSSPKGGNDPVKVKRWAGNPRYVEIKRNEVIHPDRSQWEADEWPP
jgi:hypothetical protein